MLRSKLKFDKTLLIIIAVGLVLRLVGSAHGFPFIFHPDEPALVRSATGIRFDPNPAHFDWPHLHIYLNYFLYFIFIKFRGLLNFLGLKDSLSSIFPLLWRDPLIFYFISRVFNALLGAATAIPVYLAGKRLFSREAGLFGALALVLMPFHVHVSPFALIDIPTTFWVAWAFYYATGIFKGKELKNYLLAGLFVGFAASTKYNGGLMAFMVPGAHFLRVWRSKTEKLLDFGGMKVLFLSGLLAFLGFVIGTPYSVFDYDTFSRTDGPKGAYWQFENVGKVDLPQQFIQMVEALSFEFAEDFGYTFIIIYSLTVIYSIFVKKRRDIWVILIPSLFMFFYISGFSKTRAHYYLSVYPFVALIAGVVVSQFAEKLGGIKKYLLLALVFAPPLWFGLVRVSEMYKADTRVLAYNWLLENVEEGDSLRYNTSNFLPVMKKFSDNEVSKSFENLESHGYLIVAISGEDNVGPIAPPHDDDSLEWEYEKLVEFSSLDRRGPYVYIYAF